MLAWQGVAESGLCSNHATRQHEYKAYESADVINLPAGNTTWRASNAFSWVANSEGLDADRKLALQAVAGEVLGAKAESEVIEA